MKKFSTHCLLIVLLAYTSSLLAQDEGPKFTLSGTADTYFRANLNASNDPEAYASGSAAAPATSFANLPGFSLGMFNLIGAVDVNDLQIGSTGAVTDTDLDGAISVDGSIDINTGTMGLKLVKALVKQLKGELDISGSNGTRAVIAFSIQS